MPFFAEPKNRPGFSPFELKWVFVLIRPEEDNNSKKKRKKVEQRKEEAKESCFLSAVSLVRNVIYHHFLEDKRGTVQ